MHFTNATRKEKFTFHGANIFDKIAAPVSELELQMMRERDAALLKADYWRGLFLCLLSFVAVALFYILFFRA